MDIVETTHDPFVFKGDDNKWHMLVATQQGARPFAEVYFSRPQELTYAGTFMTMMGSFL